MATVYQKQSPPQASPGTMKFLTLWLVIIALNINITLPYHKELTKEEIQEALEGLPIKGNYINMTFRSQFNQTPKPSSDQSWYYNYYLDEIIDKGN